MTRLKGVIQADSFTVTGFAAMQKGAETLGCNCGMTFATQFADWVENQDRIMRLVFFRTDTAGNQPAARQVMTVEVAKKPAGQRALRVKERTRITHWRQFADFFEVV